MDKQTQAVSNAMGTLAADARALLAATAAVAGEEVRETRKRLAAALENGKDIYGRARDKAVGGARVAAFFVVALMTLNSASAQNWTGPKPRCGEVGEEPCGDGRSWDDRFNWSGNAAPREGGEVVVDIPAVIVGNNPARLNRLTVSAGVVNFSTPVSINVVNLTGGILQTFSTLTVESSMAWTGGDFGQDRTSSGSLIIESGGALLMIGDALKYCYGSLVNKGAVTTSGSGLWFASDVSNETGATFTITAPQTFTYPFGNNLQFNNSGLFVLSGAGKTAMGVHRLNNKKPGIVQVQSGTLLQTTTGSVSDGQWKVSVNGVLDLSNIGRPGFGGGHDFENGTTLTGDGLIRLSTGYISNTGFTTNATTFELSGGELTGGSEITPGRFVIVEGGRLNWSGGAIRGAVDLPAGSELADDIARLSISGDNDKQFDGLIDNSALIKWTGQGRILVTGLFKNRPAGRFQAWSDSAIVGGSSSAQFFNEGTLSKADGIGVTLFQSLPLDNSGSIESRSGTLDLSSQVYLAGGSRFISNGLTRLSLGAEVRGHTTVLGHVELAGGSLSPRPNTTFRVESGGSLLWTNGVIYFDRTPAQDVHFSIAPNGLLHIRGEAKKTLNYTTIENAGAILLEGPGALAGVGSILHNQGTFTALNGAIYSSESIVSAFENAGTLNIGVPPGVGVFTIYGDFAQLPSGLLNIDIGGDSASQFDQLQVNGKAELGGTLNVRLVNGYQPVEGNAFAVLTFTTRNNSDFAAFEGLCLGTGLQLNPALTDTSLTLTAALNPYCQWRNEKFGPNVGELTAGPLADPNGDGINNAVAYALDLDPLGSNAENLAAKPKASLLPDPITGLKHLATSYRRRINDPTLGYLVHVLDSVVGERDESGNQLEQVGAPVPTGDGVTELVTVRLKASMGDAISKILNVLVNIY